MPSLILLSLALAAACAAGLNCYLTVFLAGLAGKLGWLPDGVGAVFSQPWVLWMAGALYVADAIVDKVPGLDSLWDLLHTVIRPAVAVALAGQFLAAESVWQLPGAVLAGIAGLTVHLTRAAVRLWINNNPGPAGNIVASLTGDAVAAGMFLLAIHQPVAGLWVGCGLLVVLWAQFPWTFRAARATGALLWSKLRMPPGTAGEAEPHGSISTHMDLLIHAALPDAGTVEWAEPCVTGTVRRFAGIAGNQRGTLVRLLAHPGVLVFVGRRWFRDRATVISLKGCELQPESTFLSEDLVIFSREEKRRAVFRFTRSHAALVQALARSLRKEAAAPAAPAEVPPAESPAGSSVAEMLAAAPVTEPVPVPPLVTLPAPAIQPRALEPVFAGTSVEPAPLPVFIEAPAPVPVAAFTPVPHSIRPFPAAEPVIPEPALVPEPLAVAEIADVPPMPPILAEAPEPGGDAGPVNPVPVAT